MFGTWNDPLSTKPSRTTGTPTVQTNAWGQPVTPPGQPKTGSLWSSSPTDALSTTSPFPKKRLGILDQIRGQSHTKPASLPGSTSTNLPSYTPPKVYETYKPWQQNPATSNTASLPGHSPTQNASWNTAPATPGLTANLTANLTTGFEVPKAAQTLQASQALQGSQAGEQDRWGLRAASADNLWGSIGQTENRLGILGKSLVTPAAKQNSWMESTTNSVDGITGAAANMMDMFGNMEATQRPDSMAPGVAPEGAQNYGIVPDLTDYKEMSIEEIVTEYEKIARYGGWLGYKVAADNLRHFLHGNSAERHIAPDWLQSFDQVIEATDVNIDRFVTNPNSKVRASIMSLGRNESAQVQDHYETQILAKPHTKLYYAPQSQRWILWATSD